RRPEPSAQTVRHGPDLDPYRTGMEDDHRHSYSGATRSHTALILFGKSCRRKQAAEEIAIPDRGEKNMGVLDGKVAIVTGTAIAIGLGEAGASVVVNYASSRDGAERTVEAIHSRGGAAIAVSGDVSKASDVSKLFAEADASYGTLDILVNNAAVYTFGPL